MSYKKTMIGFAAGAAIGALAGILLAPEKGSKTRKKIANKSSELSDTVKESFGDLMDNIKTIYTEALENMGNKGEMETKTKVKSDVTPNMDHSLS